MLASWPCTSFCSTVPVPLIMSIALPLVNVSVGDVGLLAAIFRFLSGLSRAGVAEILWVQSSPPLLRNPPRRPPRTPPGPRNSGTDPSLRSYQVFIGI